MEQIQQEEAIYNFVISRLNVVLEKFVRDIIVELKTFQVPEKSSIIEPKDKLDCSNEESEVKIDLGSKSEAPIVNEVPIVSEVPVVSEVPIVPEPIKQVCVPSKLPYNMPKPPKIRSFCLVTTDGIKMGRYYSKTPKQAASKIFTHLVRRLVIEKKVISPVTKFYVQETTSNSRQKIFCYNGTRRFAKTQINICNYKTGESKMTTFNYKNKITVCKDKVIPQVVLNAKR
jgi:hypothetical protein